MIQKIAFGCVGGTCYAILKDSPKAGTALAVGSTVAGIAAENVLGYVGSNLLGVGSYAQGIILYVAIVSVMRDAGRRLDLADRIQAQLEIRDEDLRAGNRFMQFLRDLNLAIKCSLI